MSFYKRGYVNYIGTLIEENSAFKGYDCCKAALLADSFDGVGEFLLNRNEKLFLLALKVLLGGCAEFVYIGCAVLNFLHATFLDSVGGVGVILDCLKISVKFVEFVVSF